MGVERVSSPTGQPDMRPHLLRVAEYCLVAIGGACLIVYGMARLHSRVTQAQAEHQLAEMVQQAAPVTAPLPPLGPVEVPPAQAGPTCPSSSLAQVAPSAEAHATLASAVLTTPMPDVAAWSPDRVVLHQKARAQLPPDAALGRLDIPSIDLSVIVLAGCDALALNGGVGHIDGTPRPGAPGNVGIAGHRDSFFRGLERVKEGDVMGLTTPRGIFEYRIDWIKIVDPSDVSVLAGNGTDALTLVTCYPFRYIGHAPKRYIVHGTCAGSQT